MRPLPPVCEDPGSSIPTPMAEGCNPFHPIGKWNTLQKLSERHPIAIAIQSYQEQALSHVVNNPPNKRNQAPEKMRFVYDDHVKSKDLTILNFVQGRDPNARGSPIIVRNDVVFLSIAVIARVLDNQNTTTDADVPRNNAKNTRRLTRKHRANHEIKRHLRKTRASYLNERSDGHRSWNCSWSWNCTLRHLRSRNRLETVKNS